MSKTKRAATRRPARPRRRGRHWWADLPDEELLDLKMRQLHVTLEGTALEQRVERLYEDLARKDLRFRPHVWLSTEWFSPDGVPGIALPFYLAHPRLAKLEQRQMFKVEGAGETECLRILRHEAGHTIDNAYRLHRRKRWRELFGPYTRRYPDHYRPKPHSRNYVLHLDAWYAQAHPAEDFAETFAVWLQPGSKWKQRYKGWPAMRKLEYVDELMHEIADEVPPVRTRERVEPLSQVSMTLRKHYRRKRMHYADDFPDFYDADLRQIFSDAPRYASRPTAASFLRSIRAELRDKVARWTATHPYTIDQVLRDMIDRCKELKLRLAVPEPRARQEAMIMVTVQTMNYLHSGHHRVAL